LVCSFVQNHHQNLQKDLYKTKHFSKPKKIKRITIKRDSKTITA